MNKPILTEDQLVIINDYCQQTNRTGYYVLIGDANPLMRLVQLAMYGWMLDMPCAPTETHFILLVSRDLDVIKTDHDKTHLRRLATNAQAFINSLLPSGYWLESRPEGYVVTRTALLPLPAHAFTN